MNIYEKIRSRMESVDSMAGVGLDPVVNRIPEIVWNEVGVGNYAAGIEVFCKHIIDATHDYVVDYKINSGFFMDHDSRIALEKVFLYLRDSYPDVVRVCDGKFGDVEHTAEHIASYVFDTLDADAVLLNPYMGYDAIKPFIERNDKAVVLCINTSNPSAGEIQDLELKGGVPIWRYVLEMAMTKWNQNNNIIPVVSATHLDNLVGLREIIGEIPLVLAGVGAQGGDLTQALSHVLNADGYGAMISSSRGIIYPEANEVEYWDAVGNKAHGLRESIRSAIRAIHAA